MDDSNDVTVVLPKEQETLTEYLQRYSSVEIERIIQNPVKRIEFCEILKENPWPEKRTHEKTETGYEKLRKLLENTENYENFLHCIDIWKPTRVELLNRLDKCSKSLIGISKVCSYLRIFGCAAESICTIWGLLDKKHANLVLCSAPWFGSLAFVTTIAGLKFSMDSFYEMMNVLQRDQKLFDPISKWYQQNEKLKAAMEGIFPFDLTNALMKEITDIVSNNERFSFVILLSRFLKNLIIKTKEDGKKIKDEEKHDDEKTRQMKYVENIENLVHLISSPIFKKFCEWILLQEENQVLINGYKIFLQFLKSDIRYLVCQNVRALPLADQRLSSWPVYGRIFANGLSVVSDTWRLWGSRIPGVIELQSLEKHFSRQLDVINKIVEILGEINPDS